ncbi:hypothetical protein [Pseudotabrizicola algicola]|uniref:Uncharacterized protein n=1 Tax=Pseudotabrizicola algicola TaxID=2709381 RepID=A0A6B3RN73_9RHOB|nr:hypothetical protein [Pseudotabrizicola algicola]NEX46891.1 hypothetical protein [Pseudotabrizicola algicola]
MESGSIAFELMALELQTAVEELNSEGARLFQASRYPEAKELSDRGAALQGFCAKVRALSEEWGTTFAAEVKAAPASSVALDTTRKILSASKSSKTGLLVRFPDGTVIAEAKAAETLAKAVEKIGFGEVEKLGVLVNGENLVSRKPSQRYSDTKRGAFYIKTHSSTEQKKKNLDRISDALQLGLSVSIVS